MSDEFEVGGRIRIVQGLYRKEDFEAEVIKVTPTRVYYRRRSGQECWFKKKAVDGCVLRVEKV